MKYIAVVTATATFEIDISRSTRADAERSAQAIIDSLEAQLRAIPCDGNKAIGSDYEIIPQDRENEK